MPRPRVSGNTGESISLNVKFFRDGVATDPFAIRSVKIYRSAVADENLIDEIPFSDPGDIDYPFPATQDVDSAGDPIPGAYTLVYDVPVDIPTPDIFFDLWEFIADDCTAGTGTGATDADPCLDDEDLFESLCGKFFIFPGGFFLDDGLVIPRFGFEALDLKLHQPECRTIEVGIMPLPLYDFDFNLIAPIIPHMTATFTMVTENAELLIDDEAMTVGLRQGSFRTNPFNMQFKFDTTRFLKGTYLYRVNLLLPNGETRVSPDFPISIG